MKLILPILLFAGFASAGCDSMKVHDFEGIWVAEDYLNSFEKTRSCLASMQAFDHNYPAALRVRESELQDGILSVGYGVLHDHSLHPEVSRYMLAEKDTVFEQGYFTINTQKSDSLNFYLISETPYFNYECKAYLTWQYQPDTVLILYRPGSDELPRMSIRYRRIQRDFEQAYPYPNPLYYYLRTRTLCGTYSLTDKHGKQLSNSISIGPDGRAHGYTPFDGHTFHFSSDVYCGPKESVDVVLLCEDQNGQAGDCDTYYYSRTAEGSFQLLERKWLEEEEEYTVGVVLYEMKKN